MIDCIRIISQGIDYFSPMVIIYIYIFFLFVNYRCVAKAAMHWFGDVRC